MSGNRPNKPKYEVDEPKDDLIILEVLGRQMRHLCKNYWWYKVKCKCGEIEEINQQNLDRRTCCVNCMSPSHRKMRTGLKPQELVKNVPNFATMSFKPKPEKAEEKTECPTSG